MAKIIWILFFIFSLLSEEVFAATKTSWEENFYAPVFRPAPAHTLNIEPTTKPLIPKSLRVLIFPHLGPYASPQGRESLFDEITLSSLQPCDVYASLEMRKSQQASFSGTELIFRARDLKQSLWVQCLGPVSLIREPQLKSFVYQGLFEIKPGRTSAGHPVVRVIQHLDFEDYLTGVVPSEMPSDWHIEALKAQAIAARTYAVHELREEQADILRRDYDVDDTVYYQAYLGLSRKNDQTDEAVHATAGKILLYADRPIQAYYSADSGGYTESALNVWRMEIPYCTSKPEVYDISLVDSNWTIEYQLTEIELRLKAAGILKASDYLLSVEIEASQVNKSGRVMNIRLSLQDGSVVEVFGPEFQQRLHLKSNMFQLSRAGTTLQFKGRGFGHGVGMSQWGANILSTNLGWTAEKILHFYYESVEID